MMCALWDTTDLQFGPVTEVAINITTLINMTNVLNWSEGRLM